MELPLFELQQKGKSIMANRKTTLASDSASMRIEEVCQCALTGGANAHWRHPPNRTPRTSWDIPVDSGGHKLREI